MQVATKQTLGVFWRHTQPYRKSYWMMLGVVFVTSVISIIEPIFLKRLVDKLTSGDADRFQVAGRIFFQMLWLWLSGQAVYRTMGYVLTFMQPRVMRDLMNYCYKYILGHSYGFFTNNFVGSITTRIRRYPASYERITDIFIFEMYPTALRVALVQVMTFFVHPVFGLIMLGWSIVYLFFSYFVAQYKLKYDIAASEQDTKTTAHISDTITNSHNMLVFASQDLEYQRFCKITEEQCAKRCASWNIGNHSNILQGAAIIGLEALVLKASLYYLQRGAISLGEMIMVQGYVAVLVERLWGFSNNIKNIYESLADANEMTEMLMIEHEVKDAPNATELKVSRGEVVFEDVDFHYTAENSVFKRFRLGVKPCSHMAFVGPSGGGKSTIIRLLFRLKDLCGGRILIDGQDISKVTLKSLRKALSLVPQDPILFHRSLYDNIAYGRPDATPQEVFTAAKAAHAHEFIVGFPKGYDSLVGERGVTLSGGERQRVAIARAFLSRAPILVLDEATSSLDSESESLVQDAMNNLTQDTTTIVIAHRLSTIMDLDRIVVISDGSIQNEGSHDLLMEQEGIYKKLWEIQSGRFRIAA